MSSLDKTDNKMSLDESQECSFNFTEPHMTRNDIISIISMKPRNLDLYRQAFVHKSFLKIVHQNVYLTNVPSYMNESFERLEFIGDAILNSVVAHLLYKLYPDKDEGFLTRLRTKLVRGSNCCKLAKILDLGKWVLSSLVVKNQSNLQKVEINDRLLEDVFEALIGAVYLDLGYSYAEKFIVDLITPNIDINKIASNDDNYKDILMRYTQINSYELPIYTLVDTSGKPHSRLFNVNVSLKKSNSDVIVRYGSGTANTKKEAEQNACKDAICFKKIELCNIHNCNSAKLHLDDISDLMNRDLTI